MTMMNPDYRRMRRRECEGILREPLIVPSSVLRRGGDATLEWYRDESAAMSLRRDSVRAMLVYIERVEQEIGGRLRRCGVRLGSLRRRERRCCRC